MDAVSYVFAVGMAWINSTLKSILPNPDMDIDYDKEEVEEVNMKEADVRQFGKGGAESGPNRAYDSDDEEGRPVQCQQS